MSRKDVVRGHGDRIETTRAREQQRQALLDKPDSLVEGGSVCKLVFERRILRPVTAYAS